MTEMRTDPLPERIAMPVTVYQQATTGVLHKRRSCSITSRTRYDHFPIEFTPERAATCPRCHKCWDGFKP